MSFLTGVLKTGNKRGKYQQLLILSDIVFSVENELKVT